MTKKLIDRLEELADEMKVIVHQLRVPSTIQTVEDVIEYEGQQYKKVDREAQHGDVIVFTKSAGRFVTAGKPYKVIGRCFIDNEGDDINVYHGIAEGSVETVDVYELIVEDEPKIQGITIEIDAPKSANQQRDAIIKKAKKSIVNKLVVRKGQSVYIKRTGKQEWVNVEFVVNEEKRTVVAIARWTKNNEIVARGIAKCMPTDVFNEHIGKAIALGRALGLDVSEFENAVQPTEYAIGQIVQRHDEPIDTKYKYSVDKIGNGETLTKLFDGGKAFCNTEKPLNYESEFRKSLMVVNDTNAIYTDGEQS